MALAPEPYLSACLEVLKQAALHAPHIGYEGHSGGLTAEKSDCLADLMDAVHNLPDLLQHWETCDERLLCSFLEMFDEKWRNQTSARLLGTYLHFVACGAQEHGGARSNSWDPGAAAMHRDFLSALRAPRGLILVASPTGQGKTTAIELALADRACPSDVLFMGDLRGDADAARRAVSSARSRVVVAVLRIPRAAGAFMRLIDMGVPTIEVAEVSFSAFRRDCFDRRAATRTKSFDCYTNRSSSQMRFAP